MKNPKLKAAIKLLRGYLKHTAPHVGPTLKRQVSKALTTLTRAAR